MGLDDEDLLNLRYAAMLHDVGKVSVDGRLLRKMGRLSEEELAALRLHAFLAAGVLEGIDWLRPALPAIRHHHERWDGKGYPDGLAGSEISVGARIINLAETYDVMTNGRQGDAVTRSAALAEIRVCSGSQFDPSVVDAFLTIEPLIQAI